MSEVQAWAEAFVKAQKELPEITKNKTATIQTRTGSGFSYSYADLPDIIKQIRPVLASHGLAFAQNVSTQDGMVAVETVIYHEAGHKESFGPLLMVAGQDARSAGSAISYARRYSLTAVLGIAADEDDDGKVASEQKPAKRSQAKSSQAGSDQPSEPKAAASQEAPAAAASPSSDWLDELKFLFAQDHIIAVAEQIRQQTKPNAPPITTLEQVAKATKTSQELIKARLKEDVEPVSN